MGLISGGVTDRSFVLAGALGLLLLTWAASDLLGPVAWKLGAGLVLVGAVGVRTLGRLLFFGAIWASQTGKGQTDGSDSDR